MATDMDSWKRPVKIKSYILPEELENDPSKVLNPVNIDPETGSCGLSDA